MNLFNAAVKKCNLSRPPVWFMRQAGRYHSHYQNLRKNYSFIELCKKPEVACEVALGPIRDFDFDAAILFSDLLFPLEAMGMGLQYAEGPQLDWHLRELADLKKLHGGGKLAEQLAFQGDALRLTRKQLPESKGLIGFVGGPLTLFCYAVEGSHQGSLASARDGLADGRFHGFVEKLFDLLLENMILQAKAGADVVAVLDTCAGDFSPPAIESTVIPVLKNLVAEFKKRCPETGVLYYSKGTGPEFWSLLKGVQVSALGIDWRNDLPKVLQDWSGHWSIQGNVDPSWLFCEPADLEARLRALFERVKALPIENRQGWICGLGHGILPKTPESNVKLFLKLQKEIFS